jgi:hypothetical protein
MEAVAVAAAVVAKKVFDLLASELALIVKSKLRRDQAERAFESAVAAAVDSYAKSREGRERLAEALLGKRGALAEDPVACELAQIVRFDRDPEPLVLANEWQRRFHRMSGTDFGAEAEDLVERIRTELQATEIFRPVIDSQSLSAISAELSRLHDTIRGSERQVVRSLVNFLEDRRILYDPRTGHSVATHLVYAGLSRSDTPCLTRAAEYSILEIRERIGVAIDGFQESAPGQDLLKRMRATCRWAVDVAQRPQVPTVRADPDNEELSDWGALSYGMTFLGLFRKKFGYDLRELTEMYAVDVVGPLRSILGMGNLYDPTVLAQAEALVQPYMDKHRGFEGMAAGWYERLCAELESVRAPWEAASLDDRLVRPPDGR